LLAEVVVATQMVDMVLVEEVLVDIKREQLQ
jgi:hypothetical protein